MNIHKDNFQKIAVAALATAKKDLSDVDFTRIDISQLKQVIPLLAESIPFEHLLDPSIIKHLNNGLANQQSNVSLLMRLFVLSIFKLYAQGTQHPLEKGIIRQKILSILPLFEKAAQSGKIPLDDYDKNADALAHFADDTGEIDALLKALQKELYRFDTILEKTREC